MAYGFYLESSLWMTKKRKIKLRVFCKMPLIPDTGIEPKMINGSTENTRFSSKCLSWSFSLLLQHLFYMLAWREVISYIQILFLEEGSTKNALKTAQLTSKFLFQLFFLLNSIWQLFFAVFFIWYENWKTVLCFQNPLEFLKWEFEEVKLFIPVGLSSSLFSVPPPSPPLRTLENSYWA